MKGIPTSCVYIVILCSCQLMYIMLGIPIQRKFSWKACKILRAGTIFIHSHSFFLGTPHGFQNFSSQTRDGNGPRQWKCWVLSTELPGKLGVEMSRCRILYIGWMDSKDYLRAQIFNTLRQTIMEKNVQRGYICIHVPSHFAVQQKLIQHCRSTTLQQKIF